MPVYLIVCTCRFCISPQFLLRQHRTRLHEYKSILMVAVFGCFTMESVLWPNNPIIGGWAFNFWHLFRFSMCYPKGAHSLGHRWGTAPRSEGISIFPCATPSSRYFVKKRLSCMRMVKNCFIAKI